MPDHVYFMRGLLLFLKLSCCTFTLVCCFIFILDFYVLLAIDVELSFAGLIYASCFFFILTGFGR